MTKEIDFSKYSAIKIGPKVEVTVIEEISTPLKSFYLIGGANNLLISNTPPDLAILSKKYSYIKLAHNILTVGGATPSGKIHSFCKKNSLGGLEFLGKLPGTVGGLVKMNAGMKIYEISQGLLEITTESGIFTKEEIAFGYRTSNIRGVIVEAKFRMDSGFDRVKEKLFSTMRANQPSYPSAGSVFKNPEGESAGRLIEAVGLKGFRKGNMAWSDKHANFLVNLGDGTFEDALFLLALAKEEVQKRFDIKLKEEVILL